MRPLDPNDPRTQLALRLDPEIMFQRRGMVADPWQRDILLDQGSWWLVCCGRQVGKSETVAALALHTAITRPASTTIITTPSEAQSKEVLRRTHDYYYGLFGSQLPADSIKSLKVELGNRSRVLALSGADEKFLRVYSSVALLVADEGARVADETYHAILAVLAVSGGRAILTSTPWFRRGYMYNQWKDGGDDWRRVRVRSSDCPRVDPKFLARERRSKPAAWYAQEYDAVWGSTSAALFPPELVDRMVKPAVGDLYAPQRPRFT